MKTIKKLVRKVKTSVLSILRELITCQLKHNVLAFRYVAVMSDSNNVIRSFDLKDAIATLRASKDYHSFRDNLMKKFNVAERLHVDSAAKKALECKNTHYDAICNATASALSLDKFMTAKHYSEVKHEIKAKASSVKSKSKKSKAKKVLVKA